MLTWLLLVAGDVEQNPGPVRFPCGSCDKPVRVNQDGVLCDGCEKWFHRKCIYMDREVYLQLGRSDDPWHCATCLLPAFRDSYFEDTRVIDISAITDTGTEDEMWNFSNTRNLTITHLNIRSLLPKLDEVRSRLAGRSPPSIIAFTESWLDNTVSDREICIPGYKVYRKDRNRNGGGIVLFVDEKLRINRRTDLESTDLKAVWLEIRERANRRALIGAVFTGLPQVTPDSWLT